MTAFLKTAMLRQADRSDRGLQAWRNMGVKHQQPQYESKDCYCAFERLARTATPSRALGCSGVVLFFSCTPITWGIADAVQT